MTSPVVFFGVDPGASGAIAAVAADGRPLSWLPGDSTDRDLLDYLGEWYRGVDEENGNAFAVLEEVRATPRAIKGPDGQRTGLVKMGATSAFTFGASYGRLGMALVAACIPFERVLPVKWQTVMRCRSRGDKRVTKARAQELLPGERITHRNADAYLLAMYARQVHGLVRNSDTEVK